MKKELQNEEITRIIERENVITFKRKNQGKTSVKSQKDDDQDLESAKSNNAEQTNLNKISRKNVPLPELNKQRKKLVPRNLVPQNKPAIATTYLERQVRQQDNIMLKNMNNLLTSENIKFKTKNANLEKEVARLIKMVEEDPLKNKNILAKDNKNVRNDSLSLKIALKNMQKELEDVRKENGKIKTSIKFTTIAELQIERDNILQQTARLRELLEDEKNKLFFLKANQQGVSAMQQKLIQLQQKNHYLQKENNQLKGRSSKAEQKNVLKMNQNEKNLNKMLFNARSTIKQKERELELVKSQLKKSSVKVQSLKVLQVGTGLQKSRQKQVKSELNHKVDRNDRLKNAKQKRLMSKSAQKYRSSNVTSAQKNYECENCRKLKEHNLVLNKLNQKLKADIEQLKLQKTPLGQLSNKLIVLPNKEEIETVQRFLLHRFKAHHLTVQESAYHLTNFEGKAQDLEGEISVGELLQIMMAQPFSILSDRYVQIFITVLGYNQYLTSPPTNNSYTISQDLKLKCKVVRDNFINFLGNYELMYQNKQEEMFVQIAELITQYQQHILKALTDKRNTQNTIPQKQFYQFFKEIDLEKDYIDFMVSQIILQSLDLDHLNIYNLFQIFYMPPQEQTVKNTKSFALTGGQAKKKYTMIETVVKQEDEQYEQSKSFMQSRQKQASKHNQHEQQYEQDSKVESKINQDSQVNKIQNDQYEEHFQQEKMQNPIEYQSTQKEMAKKQSPEHYHIENVEGEYIEDYEG